ncbi:hypothetical protein [Neisseria lactamica]|uniref:hypothetical protein n=1 Tax=Neisseria lactamica TaxID=486 RepID=UPI00117C7797|nr:hypothetical protein [Neisseria lactamica]
MKYSTWDSLNLNHKIKIKYPYNSKKIKFIIKANLSENFHCIITESNKTGIKNKKDINESINTN